MTDKLLNLIKEKELIKSGETVLAAFSGGADSTALLLLLNEIKEALGFFLAAAHFNHGIRGEASDSDEEFCRRLCEEKGISFYCEKADVPAFAEKKGLSIETAARLMRYDFLYNTAKNIGAASIATAHHAEDNAESILMHIIRGSGLAGLCGMKYRTENMIIPKNADPDGVVLSKTAVIRPLLGFKKSELIDYLEKNNCKWCIDETNLLPDSARNILRLSIIPRIVNEINSNAVGNILRLSEIAAEDEAYLYSLAENALDEARNNGGYLVEKLIPLPSPVKKRALRLILSENGALVDAEQAHIDGLCALLNKQSGMGIDLPCARARMVFGRLVIEKYAVSQKFHKNATIEKNGENEAKMLENDEKSPENTPFPIKMEEGTQKTPFGELRLSFFEPQAMEKSGEKEYNAFICADLNTALMDLDKLNGELSLRTRLPGDRFHPVNSEWRMKLKDFFISRRVDAKLRDAIPLLICGGEIVFIPGFLISDEVKLTEKTKRAVRIELINNQ